MNHVKSRYHVERFLIVALDSEMRARPLPASAMKDHLVIYKFALGSQWQIDVSGDIPTSKVIFLS